MEQTGKKQKPIRRIYSVSFSPTGNTRTLTETLAGQFADSFGTTFESIDFTMQQARAEGKVYPFKKGDLVVFGMPTYAGKLPNKLISFVREGFAGGGAAAAALVSFGNRSFDNALAELCELLKKDGFQIIGAGAFAAQHAFAWDEKAPAFRKIHTPEANPPGHGRPDARDLNALAEFGRAVIRKTESEEHSDENSVGVPGNADAPYYTPLGLDGNPVHFLKAKPQTDVSRCTGCGICETCCPMGSISLEKKGKTELPVVTGICMKCHACVKACPEGAMYFDDEAYLSHRSMLVRDCQIRCEPVWFV